MSGRLGAVVVFALAMSAMGLLPTHAGEDPPVPQAGFTLNVGGQDEMKTRNPLPSLASERWTADVLDRVYENALLLHPTEERHVAYIAKGVDVDEDGLFEPSSEYDVWSEGPSPATPLNITVYYDFNGVRWHDGVQMTPWDLFFAYHVNAMHSRWNTDLRALFRNGVLSAYGPGRQLNVTLDAKNWEGEGNLPGDSALRVAIRFSLSEPFVQFTEALAPVLLPMHRWSATGGGRHADFGCAVWVPSQEATERGIPQCGTSDPAEFGQGVPTTHPSSYDYTAAERWSLADQDVIGSGPFTFDQWLPGVSASVLRYDEYFTGVDDRDTTDPSDDIVYDGRLASILHKPTIDGIQFKIYRTTQLGLLALQAGEIDYYHWNVPPEFIPDLLGHPSIAVTISPDPGFAYLGYNLREAPWGYNGSDPFDDVGYIFRQAVSHLIDKKTIVQSLLQNFGVIGHGVIGPANTFWYYDGIPKPGFNLTEARALLDSPEARAAGISADPPGACTKDTPSGCRTLGPQGKTLSEILTPQADYDPVRASAGAMIAQAMRDVGINVASRPMAFGEIVNRINTHDFDMYILDWWITSWDPDYLFDLFHSSNAATGENYAGLRNATFDQIIRDSRAELNRSDRRTLVHQAQALLGDARPVDPLYYRMVVEAYRKDRYVNWTVRYGTNWNYWSLMGIAPPTPNSLRVERPRVVSAIAANDNTPVSVTVKDHNQFALQGATVNITASLGTLRLGTQRESSVVGSSNINGQLAVIFEAPMVEVVTPVLIVASATHPDYEHGHTSPPAYVLVYPSGTSFLSIDAGLPAGEVARAGQSLPMTLEVADENGDPQGDADVTISVAPPGGLQANPSSGTAIEVGTVTLLASDAITSPTDFVITVLATKAGYADGTKALIVTVLPKPPTPKVTVESVPLGRQVSLDTVARTTPFEFSCEPGLEYVLAVPTPQTEGFARYQFDRWVDLDASSRTITCTGDATYTAVFDTEYRITVDTSPTGLPVEVDGVTETAPAVSWCPENGTRSFSVEPSLAAERARHTFEGWADGGNRSRTVACDGPGIYVAQFRSEYMITWETSPEGMRLTVDGQDVGTPLSTWCDAGSRIDVEAPAAQSSGLFDYEFEDWSDRGGRSHAVVCGEPATYTARYAQRGLSAVAFSSLVILVVAVATTAAFAIWRGRRRRPATHEPSDDGGEPEGERLERGPEPRP